MIKNKVSIGTLSYRGLTLDDALRGISKAGFSCIEIAALNGTIQHIRPDTMTKAEVDFLKKQINGHNLELVTVAGHSDLTKAESVAYIKSCIDIAEEMGAEFVTTGAGEGDSKDAISQFYRNMEELGQYALEKGITIALENDGGICATGKETAKLVRNINSEGVKINYDTCNSIYFGDSGVDLEEDLKYTLDYLGHVHLKDKIGGKGIFNFPALGEGTIDFGLLLRILIDKGYTGPLSVEIEFQEDTKLTAEFVDQAVKRSHDFLDNLLFKLSG